MSSLEQLLSGPVNNIYSSQRQQHPQPTPSRSLSTPSPSSSSSPLFSPFSSNVAHAAPKGASQQMPPSQKELTEMYNNIATRGQAEPYDMLDSAVQNETYGPEGTWAMTVTSASNSPTRRVETAATVQLNRAKQDEAPVGWEVSTTFASQSGHFIGSIDQDGCAVRAFSSIGPISYQGNHQISFAGEEDSTMHNFGFTPSPFLALSYKYQLHPQATVQSFTAATKLDTIGIGAETQFVQGNIILTGKVAKKWYIFPTPDVRKGDDATAEIQQAQRTLQRSQVLTSATLSSMGDIGVNVASQIGYKALKSFALGAKLSLAQGKFDLKGAMTFFLLGRRIKMTFDQDGAFNFGANYGVWGDSNMEIESRFEINPIQLYAAGAMPVLSAKLNWNVPVPQDMI